MNGLNPLNSTLTDGGSGKRTCFQPPMVVCESCVQAMHLYSEYHDESIAFNCLVVGPTNTTTLGRYLFGL